MAAVQERTALVCPGQGSQKPGAVADLDPVARAVFDRASAIIGLDLWEAGLTYPEERLAMPSVLQPLLVAWAQADIERAQGESGGLPPFDFYLGHSSGENSAAVHSGALPFDVSVRFAYQRGLLLDAGCTAPATGMLALNGTTRARVDGIAAESHTTYANHNGPDQYVLGGSVEALARAAALAEAEGITAVRLRVAGAFHTAVFRDADRKAERLIDVLPVAAAFRPMIGNRAGQVIRTAEELRDELRGQYSRPNEWVEAMACAYREGVRTFYVTGPGNAAAGLLRRFIKSIPERVRIVRLNAPLHGGEE